MADMKKDAIHSVKITRLPSAATHRSDFSR